VRLLVHLRVRLLVHLRVRRLVHLRVRLPVPRTRTRTLSRRASLRLPAHLRALLVHTL
jgi:hypothetical protein